MKFKAYTGITWSLLELGSLLEDENSRVSFEKVKKHFGLHPFHLTNIHAALNEILSSKLNAYDPELKGFVLAYKNPKLLNSLGEIFYDTCFIHIDVEADFYIFRPQVGCTLTGVVNKKGLSHIGLLVHKAFNISIPKPDGEEDWPGDKVEIGQEVRVHVTHLDYTSRLPFIRGAVDNDDYLQGCKLPPPRDTVENRKLSICMSDESEDIPANEESSKRNISRPFFTSDSDESAEEEELTLTKLKEAKEKKQSTKQEPCSSNEIEVKQKKQKKSKKVKNENKDSEPNQEQFNDMSLNSANAIDQTLDETLTNHATKKSKTKSSKKLMEPPLNDTIPKLKKERVRTTSSSESAMDDDTYTRKIKKERPTSIQRQSDVSDAEVSTSDSKAHIKTSSTKASKKTKLPKAQSEDVDIKKETVAAIHEEGQKKKRKKNKHKEQDEETPETQPDINDSSIIQEESSTKKSSKKSKSTEIGINVKEEALAAQNHTNNIKAERRGSQDSTIEKEQENSEPTTITPDAIVKIKKERSISQSGSETEKSPRKIKTDKRSKSKKQTNDDNYDVILDRSTESPAKRSPKKMKVSESETVPVKHEMAAVNNAQSENSDAMQNNSQSSPKKKKSKKRKDTEEDETHNIQQNIKTECTNSTGFNLSLEIPIVVKQEKISSDYETERNETSTSTNQNQDESVPNTEETGKKKKKKKKHDKGEPNTEKMEASFEVMIKTEPENYSDIDSKVKKSSKKKLQEKNKSGDHTEEPNDFDYRNIKIKREKDC